MSDCQALGCDKPTVNGTTCERHSERCFVAGCEEVYDWGSGGLCADHLSAAVAMFLERTNREPVAIRRGE